MQDVLNLIKDNSPYILIAMTIVIIIFFFILMAALKSISKLNKKYRKLFRGVEGKNLEKEIIQHMDKIDDAVSKSRDVTKKCNEIEERIKTCVQKTAIVRYKAFDNVGSDLSFSIALLNQNNSGIILTSIYGRNESTSYAKPIDMGISRYDLSDEENEALKKAMDQ